MAPLKPVTKERNDRVESTLNLANKALSVLQTRDGATSGLEKELLRAIQHSFPLLAPSTASRSLEIDALACDLWNAATNVSRQDEHRGHGIGSNSTVHLVTAVRSFAFLLMDTTYRSVTRLAKDLNRQIRTLKIGLRAARYCLDHNELELAMRLLQSCADHAAENGSPTLRDSHVADDQASMKAELRVLVAQFSLLRMAHAWKSENLTLAEYWFEQFSNLNLGQNPSLAEMFAQLSYDAGKSLSDRGLDEPAIKWLKRSFTAVDDCDARDAAFDAVELRLEVAYTLVKQHLSKKDASALAEAEAVVEKLRFECQLGNRIAVQLMYLHVLLAGQLPDAQRIEDVIMGLLRTAVLTDDTFKRIMRAMHCINKTHSQLARQALERLITNRLIPDMPSSFEGANLYQAWTEQACVTCTLFATKASISEQTGAANQLEHLFSIFKQRSTAVFRPQAAHAAQMLIWKATTDATSPELADRWCMLMRHDLFESAGQVNKARIGRKAMNMAITNGNLEAARAAFFQMSPSIQNESLTRYLAFKLAIKSNDYDLALDSLQVILKFADRDATFLYACTLEAQRSEMRQIAVAALQAILDKRPPGVHLPSLLRCTARLLIGELDTPSRGLDEIMQETVRNFESASENLAALQQGSTEQWRSEVQWWSKNAYNLVLKLCGQAHPELLVRLLQAAVKFIDAYPRDGGVQLDDDVYHRLALCHFLAASVLIVLGRSQDERSEYSLQRYLQARQQIAAYMSLREKQKEHDRTADDRHRLFELLKFDLECIFNLQQWEDVSAALQACLQCENVERWDAIADIVLILHQNTGSKGLSNEANSRMMELLDRIINDTWKKGKDIFKASRWLRLCFSLDLSDGDGRFAFKLLGQAAGMAKRQQDRQKEPFPENELQWLATTAFNRSIDLLSAGATDGCIEWIDGALEMARYAGDNGALHANLTDRKEQVLERIRRGVAS